MLDGDDMSGSMIESVVDLLGSHDDLRLEDLRLTISKLSLVVISRSWTDIGSGMNRPCFGL